MNEKLALPLEVVGRRAHPFPISLMGFRSTDCHSSAGYTRRMSFSAAEDEAAARKRRAANRGQMTVRVLTLGDEEPAEAPPQTSAERISLLVQLTAAAWAMTGQPWPSVPRAQWPGRVRLLGEEA